jgi:hypothetical protein
MTTHCYLGLQSTYAPCNDIDLSSIYFKEYKEYTDMQHT